MARATTDQRRADLAKIHALKKQHAVDDDSYRAIIAGLSRGATVSSADLDAHQRRALIARLNAFGGGHRPRYRDSQTYRMCRGMWIELWRAGAVEDRRDGARDAFIRRQTGQEVGALDNAPWTRVIEALKAWAKRAEILGPEGRVESWRLWETDTARAAQHEVLEMWTRLAAAGVIYNPRRAALNIWLQKAVTGNYRGVSQLAPGEAREALRKLAAMENERH